MGTDAAPLSLRGNEEGCFFWDTCCGAGGISQEDATAGAPETELLIPTAGVAAFDFPFQLFFREK